jgi:phosphocarrier protein
VDGKSILGLLTLAAAMGTQLRLTADGRDAAQAVEALSELMKCKFGEGQ